MENLPRFIRQSDVVRIVGLSKSEIWRRVNAGTFPTPIRLGDRATRWEASELEAWMKEWMAHRPAKRAA